MIVLLGLKLADKENMYKETKHSLINYVGNLTEGKARPGLDMKFEPSWRKSTSSSNRIVHVHCCDIEWKKKK